MDSSSKATLISREDECDGCKQENEKNMIASTPHNTAMSNLETSVQQQQPNLSQCNTLSVNRDRSSASAELSVGNQVEEHPCSSDSSPKPPTTQTLPKLRLTAPAHCVIPNCCDYFTSPHPHYPKEVVGKAQKVEEPLNSDSLDTNSTGSEDTSEVASGASDSHFDPCINHVNDSNRSSQDCDEFEMWDYVCPQYARRGYANEWV